MLQAAALVQQLVDDVDQDAAAAGYSAAANVTTRPMSIAQLSRRATSRGA